jgi:predicted PurR-regulated permease PerM
VIPLMIAILITALLWPAFAWMLRHRVPRWLAILISVVGTVAIVAGLLWLVVWQIMRQWSSVQASTVAAIGEFRQYLIDGPLHLSAAQIDDLLAQGFSFLQEQASLLWSGALAVGSTIGHVVTGALLALFILLCLLADGAGIWRWTMRLFPVKARAAADGAGRAGWVTVVNYARTQLLVATIDAIGIGLGAALLGVPLAIPVAVLVFLGSFIPIVGAVVTGAVAVFLALVYNGPWIALWMLVVVLGVQQLEGHVLQPLLMGSAVKVHPLAVVLVVAGGAMIAGIPGALFAVPLAAFVNVVAVYLSERAWETGARPTGDLIWSTVPRPRRVRS